MHASPPLRILAIIAPSTAASMSASSKTMNGALPPSSIEQLITLSAASREQDAADLGGPGEGELADPRVVQHRRHLAPDLREVSTLTTPSGTPASASSSAIASAVSGVSAAGLSTTVQPAARAGPILRVAIAAGKFHGVMSTRTPIGWRMREDAVRRRTAPA